MTGIFYGIGVGPGDPELLTMKAIKTLENVDVIIAPKTEKKDGSVALSIARPYLKATVEIVYQVFPMITHFEKSPQSWQKNKEEILALLNQGKNVAFLTLGDPMFYSTYIYVHRLLKAEAVDIRTIPGIPAFCAIAGRLEYPLVEGNDIISVIPATADPEKIKKALAVSDNVVIMKVYKNFEEIVAELKAKKLAKNAVMVSRCGLDDEECIYDIEQVKKVPNYLSTILSRRNK
ncbi:precorrin-2 C(20)-methyltransferase [Pectinatus cerevisiiphilus]|uniref:Precorrin-2/cobalt-factor-2 C20-methyltransferase n=1 Tax=Pectinatus cerevisiiphilus TaxID=86956 RepID=A0A4R3KGA6_9FIRM|nr:precorrin-2 C(20)-methyltransferase [Pectinatus cerevisiiphilus]TCS82049.1 precorrin-2/cobalt-factor-2 C20-methyltransferase [Pectinatus cerevisiiphilus]